MPKFLKENMNLNWNFQRNGVVGGFKTKKHPCGRYGYSLEQHNVKMLCLPGIEYSALSLSYPRNVTISG